MARPPTSVRSVRLTDLMWSEITAKAEAQGFTVNGFIAAHMNKILHPEMQHFVVRTGPASQRAEALVQRQRAENERMAGWFSPKGKK